MKEDKQSVSAPRILKKLEKSLFQDDLAQPEFFESEEDVDRYVDAGLAQSDSQKQRRKIAHEVAWQAGEALDPDWKVHLAHRALALDPDCVDAHNALAEELAGSAEEEIYLYQKAVRAGERYLGKDFFEENKGHFYGIVESRPYMRARAGLARAYWDAGNEDQAIKEYLEMLELNPNDNQGIRYILLSRYCDLGNFEAAQDFIETERYQDDAGLEWVMTKALLSFHREGPSENSNLLLRAALERNTHVADYMTGRRKPPHVLPDSITMRGEDEAYCYAAEFIKAWKEVKGSIDWVKQAAEKNKETGRNDLCSCGSGKKFKKCCGH